ncbi:MAG: SLC45 family MFS transporter [Ruminococcaceae bacterium]|nr:SLC45 family MFS transporter [Oscillospiraceae bacterium]
MKTKLNYRRTILVGFAFFLISAFWQAYDNAIPLTLTNKFGMSQAGSGVVMALDNVLAVILLPIFGALSDRCRSKRGRRTPFVLVGTVLASIMLVFLTFADNAQLSNIRAVEEYNPTSLGVIFDSQAGKTLKTPDGEEFVLSNGGEANAISRDQFLAIPREVKNDAGKEVTNADYTDYVAPARQAYAAQVTEEHGGALVWFMVLLLGVLVSMAIFRSPAVALMPDVTLKPLRSKGNAIINLMGTAGGILVLLLGKAVFDTSAARNSLMSYTGFFGLVIVIMLLALTVFLTRVKEPQWAAEMLEKSRQLGLEEPQEEKKDKKEKVRKLSKGELGSLLLILLSVALWYMGYNAVTSKYSVYSSNVLNKDYNTTLLIAQGAAIISYLPVGMIASRLGRKKTILAGVAMLATAFGAASFMRADSPDAVMYVLFALAGIAWATINVNSFPMVVELCTGGNVGRYTGFYYTASMAAQAITPWIAGWFMDKIAWTALFPYAAIFVGLAFVTMFFVRHGDSKPQAKKGLEALDTDD